MPPGCARKPAMRARCGLRTVQPGAQRHQLRADGLARSAAEMLRNLPDLQALFGSLDYCECSDCRSVFSPGRVSRGPVAISEATCGRRRLRECPGGAARPAARPAESALGCNNTEITLPYIDVVNELLEAAIAPPATPVTLIETTGTPQSAGRCPSRSRRTRTKTAARYSR